SVAFSPDGGKIVCASADLNIRIVDASSGAMIGDPMSSDLELIPTSIIAVSTSDNTGIIAISRNTFWLWNSGDNSAIRLFSLIPAESGFRDLTFTLSADGAYIYVGCSDGMIRQYDVSTAEIVKEIDSGSPWGLQSIAVSRDGALIASATVGTGAAIQVWNARTGKPVCQPFRGLSSTVRCLAFSSDGRRIAFGSNDCTVRIWDIHQG
ncbi:WD40 repeat-like protein, partial [Punctularia strigosozonata HHB-11173 SS5]